MHKTPLPGLPLGSVFAMDAIAVAASSGATGWHGHRSGYGGIGRVGTFNLSDAQRAQIKQIMRANRDRLRLSRQALRRQRATILAMTPNAVAHQAAASSLAQAEGRAVQE